MKVVFGFIFVLGITGFIIQPFVGECIYQTDGIKQMELANRLEVPFVDIDNVVVKENKIFCCSNQMSAVYILSLKGEMLQTYLFPTRNRGGMDMYESHGKLCFTDQLNNYYVYEHGKIKLNQITDQELDEEIAKAEDYEKLKSIKINKKEVKIGNLKNCLYIDKIKVINSKIIEWLALSKIARICMGAFGIIGLVIYKSLKR